jgi:hypothetical protein
MSSDDEIGSQKLNSKPTKDVLNRSTSMSDKLTIPAKSMQIQESSTSIERKTVLARAELWDRRLSINENESKPSLLPVDIEQWSSEFEKIQNEN